MSLLSIEGVRKEYQVRGKRVVALESIDLDIREGEFVTIVGPSGCGKSTSVEFDCRPAALERPAGLFSTASHRRHLHARSVM